MLTSQLVFFLFVNKIIINKIKMDPKFVNVLILGFGFMFLFTAFQTMGNIEVR